MQRSRWGLFRDQSVPVSLWVFPSYINDISAFVVTGDVLRR